MGKMMVDISDQNAIVIPKWTANFGSEKNSRCIYHQFPIVSSLKKKHMEHEVIFPMKNHNKLPGPSKVQKILYDWDFCTFGPIENV